MIFKPGCVCKIQIYISLILRKNKYNVTSRHIISDRKYVYSWISPEVQIKLHTEEINLNM